jgi:hypothetical protein
LDEDLLVLLLTVTSKVDFLCNILHGLHKLFLMHWPSQVMRLLGLGWTIASLAVVSGRRDAQSLTEGIFVFVTIVE